MEEKEEKRMTMGKEVLDWEGLAKNVIKEVTKMSIEEYAKFSSFRPDFKVIEREGYKDQWYLQINGEEYKVGYIFLRDLYLVYDKEGKMVIETRPKKEK